MGLRHLLMAGAVLLAAAAPLRPQSLEPPRAATVFSAEDEALYAARFARLMEDMKVRAGLTAYEPLEAVPGAARPRALPGRMRAAFSPQAAAAAIAYAGQRNSTSLMVTIDGRIALEQFFGANRRDTLVNAQSMAKPVTALVIGRAIRLGHIRSLDQPVADFITEWRGDPVRSRILIRHLLDMRSGLLPQGFSPDPADVLNRAYLHPRHDEVIIRDYPATHEPGTRYEYSNANAELIAPIIERATGQRYAAFLGEALLQPLGAPGGQLWVNRPGGTAHSGCCLLLPVESWLKLGMLLLNDGTWKGKRLLPEGYVAEMLTPTAQNPYAGLGVWVAGRYIERRGFAHPDVAYGKVLHSQPYADRDLFLFDGNGNQVMYMIPSQKMIILRTGGNPPKDAEWDNSYLPNLLIRDAAARGAGALPQAQPH